MFGISVSGIKNSQKHIDVTSNNIANTNSYGFKKSRAEFADVYANSIYSNSKTASGRVLLIPLYHSSSPKVPYQAIQVIHWTWLFKVMASLFLRATIVIPYPLLVMVHSN